MRRKLLSYADAAKLLGGESAVITALGKLAGTSLTVASAGGVDLALHLFEVKEETERLSQDAIRTLRERLTGLHRFKRNELIEAAHAVLVVSAFFSALDDLDSELGAALNSATLDLTRGEQVSLASYRPVASNSLRDMIATLADPGMIPGLQTGADHLGMYYSLLASHLAGFAAGTAVWDARDETTRERWTRAVRYSLAECGVRRYEERLAQLAGEFPEFAFWAYRAGSQQVLKEVRGSREDVAGLARLLTSSAGEPEKVRSDLVRRYQARAAKPVAEVEADGVTLPVLREMYVSPAYRIVPQTTGLQAAIDYDWEQIVPREDLWAMVLGHIVSTQAIRAPLMLLGQPGAGKSAFTQMLAAELDPRYFLVIRVELRAVPADTGIREQIEAALTNLTGRVIGWPELAESAGDAQPVILLDGFDELLQASGVTHFDFLERVQAFQEREADLDRPVAVLVTSRTAVANQVRYPRGTCVAKIEEFDDNRIAKWLDVWNRFNLARPLPPEEAVAQGDLARQPLLLFLLALFRSGGGHLSAGMSQAHLLERLFTDFVRRDIDKTGAHLTDRERRHAVQRDLDHLSMVAFAMFNRGRQSVTEADLITDLAALTSGAADPPVMVGQAAALNIAERLAGRFFFRLFVHRDQVTHGQNSTRNAYEFLHATFGEFLVARWVVAELSRLGEHARRFADDPYPPRPDDARFRALLSVAVFSTREQRILKFIASLLVTIPAEDLSALKTLVTTLYRECLRSPGQDPYLQYQPAERTLPAKYAAYSANLALLLLLLSSAGDRTDRVPVDALSVTGARSTPRGGFYAVARLWYSQLSPAEWNSLRDVLYLRHDPDPVISLRTRDDAEFFLDGRAILRANPAIGGGRGRLRPGSDAARAFQEAALLDNPGYQGACGTLLPYLDALGVRGMDDAFSLAVSSMAEPVLALLMPASHITPSERARAYKELFSPRMPAFGPRLLLGRLRDDVRDLPPDEVASVVLEASVFAWMNITAFLDILARMANPIELPHRIDRPLEYLFTDAMHAISQIAWTDQHVLLDFGGLGASGARESAVLLAPEALPVLLGLRDLLDIRDPRDLSGMIFRLRIKPQAVMETLYVGLWTNMLERGLPPLEFPDPLHPEEAADLIRIAPDFVERTRRLATDNGIANPIPSQ
jgi:hypothetical protein